MISTKPNWRGLGQHNINVQADGGAQPESCVENHHGWREKHAPEHSAPRWNLKQHRKETNIFKFQYVLCKNSYTLCKDLIQLVQRTSTACIKKYTLCKELYTLFKDCNNNNNSCTALYPVKIYKLAVLYIINIKIHLTIKKAQVL